MVQDTRSGSNFGCLNRLNLRPAHVDKICIFFGEFLATAMLMFLGCMGCIQTDVFSNSSVQTAINFGFVILICIQSFGCVSGAHLNPAVTIAAFIYDQLSAAMAVLYFVAQMLGSFIGYGLLKVIMPTDLMRGPQNVNGLCVTALNDQFTAIQGALIEFTITCIIIIMCCGVWDPRNARYQDSLPVRFGLAVASISMTAGKFTGASMNPARSFGPALWNNYFENHWIYWVGPLAAGLLMPLVYKMVFRREANEQNDNDKFRSDEETV